MTNTRKLFVFSFAFQISEMVSSSLARGVLEGMVDCGLFAVPMCTTSYALKLE